MSLFLDLFDLHQGVVDFYFLCVHDIQPIEFKYSTKGKSYGVVLLIIKFHRPSSIRTWEPRARLQSSNVAMYI